MAKNLVETLKEKIQEAQHAMVEMGHRGEESGRNAAEDLKKHIAEMNKLLEDVQHKGEHELAEYKGKIADALEKLSHMVRK